MMDFSPVESTILNRIQKDFPLVADPLRALSEELSLPENVLHDTITRLKKSGVVRTVSGIFSAERLGYASTLVAFSVNERDLGAAASTVNSHPGVSHNYQRNHHYNIWFTIATESEEKLEPTVAAIARRAGCADYLVLRNEKMLKLGVMFAIGDGTSKDTPAAGPQGQGTRAAQRPLSGDEKNAVRILQMDLPIQNDPFEILLKTSGITMEVDAFLDAYRTLHMDGILRRYSAVLRHREVGYSANAMTAWKPGSGADIRHIADLFSGSRSISHLYMRTLYPGRWEYPLFAMIHARTDEELKKIIEELSSASGMSDYLVLNSVKEFKKERVTYFSPEFTEWNRKAGI